MAVTTIFRPANWLSRPLDYLVDEEEEPLYVNLEKLGNVICESRQKTIDGL